MKVLVFGCGGTGMLYGFLLHNAGHEVTWFARPQTKAALLQTGMRLQSAACGDQHIGPAALRVVDDPQHVAPDTDFVLFCVKSPDAPGAAATLARATLPHAVVICVANGIAPTRALEDAGCHCLALCPGIAYCISNRLATGVVQHLGEDRRLVFGSAGTRGAAMQERLLAVQEVMQAADIRAELSDNVQQSLWRKYVVILSFAGITGLTRAPAGQIREDEHAMGLFRQLTHEAALVAAAEGFDLPDVREDVAGLLHRIAPDSKASLLHDLEAGRATEIETLHGELVRRARGHGIAVPVTTSVYVAVRMADRRGILLPQDR